MDNPGLEAAETIPTLASTDISRRSSICKGEVAPSDCPAMTPASGQSDGETVSDVERMAGSIEVVCGGEELVVSPRPSS